MKHIIIFKDSLLNSFTALKKLSNDVLVSQLSNMDSERIWRIVDNHRSGVPRKKPVSSSTLSLTDRLHDLYIDCLQSSSDKNADKRFRATVNLLSRLDRAHARLSLIVNLYEDEKGYSLVLCTGEGGETDEIFMPYEDNEIFNYLDNQEVPPILMEVLDHTKYCQVYSGCVVCEVRDYRAHSVLAGYDKHLLLLKPTTETLLATVNKLGAQVKASQNERELLEARMLLTTQPPLCLDTTTDVLWVTNRLHYNKRKYHTHSVRQYLRRRCHASRALMSEGETPEELSANEFIDKERVHRRNFVNNWKNSELSIDTSQLDYDSLLREVSRLAVVTSHENLLAPHPPTPPPPPPPPPQPSQPTQPAHLPAAPVELPVLRVNDNPSPLTSEPPPSTHTLPRPHTVVTTPIQSHPPPTQPVSVVQPPEQPPISVIVQPPPLPPPSIPVSVSIGTSPPVTRFSLTPPKLRPLLHANLSSSVMKSTLPRSQSFPPSSLTPPKLSPIHKRQSPSSKVGRNAGMPRLHPLNEPHNNKSPVNNKSKTSPTMPRLYRIPTAMNGVPQFVNGRGSIPLTPLFTALNVPSVTGSTTPTQLNMPGTTGSITPTQVSVLNVTRSVTPTSVWTPLQNSARADTRMPASLASLGSGEPRISTSIADTRMPASLASLGTAGEKKATKKRSRSSKLISGNKVIKRKKK